MTLTMRIALYLILSVLFGSRLRLTSENASLTIISMLISICLMFVTLASIDYAATRKSSR